MCSSHQPLKRCFKESRRSNFLNYIYTDYLLIRHMHCGWDSGAADNLSICGSEVFLKCLIEFFSRRFRSKLVFWFSDNSLGLGGKVEKLRKPLQVALQEPWPHPEIKIYYVILMWFIFIIRNKFLCHQREKTIGQNLIFL